MKAIAKRIQRLEGQMSPRADLAGYQALCIIYERRRRRAEREGVPFDELPPEPHVGPSRPLTPADVIRLRQAKRLAREAGQPPLQPGLKPQTSYRGCSSTPKSRLGRG
jgi:hypothetical protein